MSSNIQVVKGKVTKVIGDQMGVCIPNGNPYLPSDVKVVSMEGIAKRCEASHQIIAAGFRSGDVLNADVIVNQTTGVETSRISTEEAPWIAIFAHVNDELGKISLLMLMPGVNLIIGCLVALQAFAMALSLGFFVLIKGTLLCCITMFIGLLAIVELGQGRDNGGLQLILLSLTPFITCYVTMGYLYKVPVTRQVKRYNLLKAAIAKA